MMKFAKWIRWGFGFGAMGALMVGLGPVAFAAQTPGSVILTAARGHGGPGPRGGGQNAPEAPFALAFPVIAGAVTWAYYRRKR